MNHIGVPQARELWLFGTWAVTTEPNITISDQIQQALTDQIIRGQLLPDEKLRQDHIAKTFNTSHVPVREALLRLEARGRVPL